MARTKVKMIDDSLPQEEVKEEKKPKRGDSLIESLKAELGEVEAKPKKDSQVEGEGALSVESSERSDFEDSKESAEPSKQEEPKKVHHPKVGKTKYRSKKYQERAQLVDPELKYKIPEAVDLAKQSSYSKYDGSLEIHLNTKIKNLRGSVSLPFVSGKKKTILAFGAGAKESGADIVGDDSKIEAISGGKVDFDVLITTPEWMPKLASLAKVLGPKGLMPNPKNGTITENLKKAVDEIQTGKLDYKTENNGKVIHLSLGKISQPNEELEQNVKVLLSSIGKSKLNKAVLSPTLGPGIKLDINSI